MNEAIQRDVTPPPYQRLWYQVTLGALMLAIVSVAGGGHFYFAYRQAQSESYRSVEGTMTECYWNEFGTDGERELIVAYDYAVDGKAFAGYKIRYVYRPFPSDSALVRQRCGKWAKGKPVEVFYNPQDPADAILDKGFCNGDRRTLGACVGVLCLLVLSLGLWMLTLALQRWPRTKRWLNPDLQIICKGPITKVPLPKTTPYADIWFLTASLAVFAVVLYHAAGFFLLAPALVPAALWVLYLAAPVLLTGGLITWRMERASYGLSPELVIDTRRGTITFPNTAERGERTELALQDVREIAVKSPGVRKLTDEFIECQFECETHTVTVTTVNGWDVARVWPVAPYDDLQRASQLADWLRTQLWPQAKPTRFA